MQKALGILETMGLLAAVTAADTMVKAANVELIGYELAKGQGMTAVKIQGDVGAVRAALASGEAQVREMGLFRGKDLIPRPAENLEVMVFNDRTEGYVKGGSIKDRPGRKKVQPEVVAEPEVIEEPEVFVEPEVVDEPEVVVELEVVDEPEVVAVLEVVDEPEEVAVTGEVCNLCGDPKCTRKKGQPHKFCIHFDDIKE